MTKLPMDTLRNRVSSYLEAVNVIRIIDGESITALAPMETGQSQFIDVSDLPDINDLPYITERKRDFAFRYATEYKTNVMWADEYSVHIRTIHNWLRQPNVRAYISLARYEQRMSNIAQRVSIQRRVNGTIDRILKFKLTADTVDAVGKMARFMYQAVNEPENAKHGDLNQFNLNIGINNQPAIDNQPNPYAQSHNEPINVTPKQLEDLEAEIKELDVLAEGFMREREREANEGS